MRQLLCAIGFVLAAGQSAAAVPEFKRVDGPSAVEAVAQWTNGALMMRDFRSIDEALEQFLREDRRFVDGLPMASGVASGMSRYCARAPLGERAMESVRDWRRAFPQSAAAVLVEACLWKESAWSARGPGYAREVSDEGWKLFRERLHRAGEILLAGKSLAAGTPLWYVDYMEVQLGLGMPMSQIEATFRDGQSRFPRYEPLYFQLLRAHLPQWRSDGSGLESALRRSVRPLRDDEADAMYARGWWYVEQNAPSGEIFALGAEWSRIQRGLERLIARFPDSDFNRSKMAAFACRARDGDSYRLVRRNLGDRIRGEAFEFGFSVETCDQTWAAGQSLLSFVAVDRDLDLAIRKACGKMSAPNVADAAEVVRLFPLLIEARRALRDRYRAEDPDMAASLTDNLGFLTRVTAADPREVCGVVGFAD